MSEYINNREERQKVLKKIILDLHEGKSVEEVKGRFQELIKDIAPTEISNMEQALISEGLPVDEVKRLCDVHTAVFMDSLDQQQPAETTPGHPVHTFKKENRAVEEVMNTRLRPALEKLESGDKAHALPDLRLGLSFLGNIEKHYTRKENLLFPFLEKYGVTGPTSVMWGVDDDIRAKFKETLSLASVHEADLDSAAVLQGTLELLSQVDSMIYKEENILFPMCMDLLTEEEWGQIANQSAEIGYCLVEPDNLWVPGKHEAKAEKQKDMSSTPEGYLKLDTGILTLKEINFMLRTLPVDITFVDKDDTVKYFSQGKERIFLRSPAIIGRKVQNCHPPASVHIVEKIVEELKAGTRDHADFWIQMQGMFVYIRYFAVRDENGEYLGTLEVTQNIKGIKELEGEKRLAD